MGDWKARMARTTGTASLADLVEAGRLEEGEALVLFRRSKPGINGVLQADGTIAVGSASYKTPSEAARKVLAARAADGWLRWRVPRLGDRTLADVRDEAR